MKIWKQVTSMFRKSAAPDVPQTGNGPYLNKYKLFRRLLSQNNKALELMAQLEESLSGEFPADRYRLCGIVSEIASNVRDVVDTLNLISDGNYRGLYAAFGEISEKIGMCLRSREEIPVAEYTAPFDRITADLKPLFGNKNANLGEVRNRLKIPTPDGFAVSTYAFLRFMEHSHLFERIASLLSNKGAVLPESMDELGREIREIVLEAEIPPELEKAVRRELEELSARTSISMGKMLVSVRSSALHEDGELSFAGQYSTFLNVAPELILQRYREVVASAFAPGALLYSLRMLFGQIGGLGRRDGSDSSSGVEDYLRGMLMSVGVLLMIDARSAGVAYSEDPNNPGSGLVLVSAVRGLGKSLVGGTETPQTYSVSRDLQAYGAEMEAPGEDSKAGDGRASGGLDEQAFLNAEQLRTIAGYAISLEKHYSYPQDIEWAIDGHQTVRILQTRPLKMSAEYKGNLPPVIRGHHVLLDKGIIASRGIGAGKAFVSGTEKDAGDFPEGAVLVARHASARWAAVLGKASAVLTDVGASTVHMATIARELRVPAIVDTEKATEVIRNGQEITVDAFNGIVYEGYVRELSEFLERIPTPFKDGGVPAIFDGVIERVVPLNLVDPGSGLFSEGNCRTLHDIIRFAHQKAMSEMFRISEEFPEGAGYVKLAAGIPLLIYLIDLGAGLSASVSGSVKTVRPEHVESVPFNAFFRGLASVVWPDTRHVDAAGFVGMMAHTASMTESEIERMAERSFSFIAAEYMNFSINLGYHISVVEAFAGDNINDNYIRFFFKGGGADLGRRIRRVRLISEVLRRTDFEVRVTQDVVRAVTTKDRKASLERKLETLGRLTVYTKQLDAILPDDSKADLYLSEFIGKYFPSAGAVP